MNVKNLLTMISPILLILAIGLSPRFTVGHLANGKDFDVRIEDILLLVFGAAWLFQVIFLKKGVSNKPPLMTPILMWLLIGLFSTLVNAALLNTPQPSRTFFYFLKEIEYFFLFFYVFYHVKSIDSAKTMVQFWMVVGLVNAAWIFFQLFSGFRFTHYYGPTPFIEPEGTFPGGGFFLILFIFLLNVSLYYYFSLNMSVVKKTLLLTLISTMAVGVLSSGSRSAFLGLLVATLVSFFMYAVRAGLWKSMLVFGFIAMFVLGVFTVSPPTISEKTSHTAPLVILERFSNIEAVKVNLDPENEMSRPGIWLHQFRVMAKKSASFVFGFGKGAILGGLGESHSQYVRNFVETGFVGLSIFIALLYAIVKNSLKGFLHAKEALVRGVAAGLFCSTLAMITISLFAEGFLVVKINEVYWFFAALTFAVLWLPKKHENPIAFV